MCLRTETGLGPSALHLLGAVRSCGLTSPPVGHKARRPQEFGTESILQLEPERLGVWGRSQASGNWRPLGLEEPSRTLALYHSGSQARADGCYPARTPTGLWGAVALSTMKFTGRRVGDRFWGHARPT